MARIQNVYTLLVEVGRAPGDGLPDGASGGALLCYASGVDEAEAVRETVAVLKQADMAPLDVTGYGTLEDRLEHGHEIPEEERALMEKARAENAVIVAEATPLWDDEAEDGDEADDTAAAPRPKQAGTQAPKSATRRRR